MTRFCATIYTEGLQFCVTVYTGGLRVCSIRCRRRKAGSTPSIRSCARTSANLSRERLRSPRWKWTCLIPITRRWSHRSLPRTWTVGRRCWDTRGGDSSPAGTDETPTKITNTTGTKSSRRKTRVRLPSSCLITWLNIRVRDNPPITYVLTLVFHVNCGRSVHLQFYPSTWSGREAFV